MSGELQCTSESCQASAWPSVVCDESILAMPVIPESQVLCQKIRHGIPLVMSGSVFSEGPEFDNALIVEGIRVTEMNDTA